MMVKKKLLAIVAAAAMVIPAFSLSASAKCGDDLTVGGLKYKLVQDFNDLSNGFRFGMEGDKIYTCRENKMQDKHINFHVADKTGADESKAMVFSAEEGIDPKDGCFSGVEYNPSKDPNGRVDWRGATDLVFWIDCTKEVEKEASVQIVIQEWDYNTDGTPYMKEDAEGQLKNVITARNLYSDPNVVWYTLGADGKWQERKGIKSNYIFLEKAFKGYVRVPLSIFDLCWEDPEDINEKFDLTHIEKIGFYGGVYPKHIAAGQSIAIDNVGFAGDIKDAAPTTAEPDPTTVKTTTKNTATTAPADTTNGTTNGSSSPATGEMPITAALITAVVFTGVLVASKKRVK